MHRWEDSIRVFLEDTGWKGMDGCCLAMNRGQQLASVNIVMNRQVL
jgi:hypothetical protein